VAWTRRWVEASTSDDDRVVHQARAPVLLVSPDAGDALHHALVVVDGAAETVHAAQVAIDLLDAPATLCLAFAPSRDAAADRDGQGVDATPLVAKCLDGRLRARATTRGIALQELALSSNRVSELTARVEELQIDLLVLPLLGYVLDAPTVSRTPVPEARTPYASLTRHHDP
jgi:hypothetical protein